ncbi:hypothetical protein niasHS_001332 [Heterodera schachtii]|uniref:Uncharacterized protein n=1 Tax=Heterodera schachtii TaxID=97005 RepID=A0ABD2KLA4_HETSC
MSNFGYDQQQVHSYYVQGDDPDDQHSGCNVPPPSQEQQPFNSQHFAEQGQAGMPKNDLGFNNQTIRSHFVRKVFSIVGIMLAVVTLMSAFPFMHPPTMHFVYGHQGYAYVAYAIFLIVYFTLICCGHGLRRSYPINIVLLAILTLSIGFVTMMFTAHFAVHSVFMIFTITALSCFGVALFATIVKKDLTNIMGIVIIATLCLALFGVGVAIAAFFTDVHILQVIFAAIGAILVMIMFAINIQLILGGRTYEISTEEHIYASIILFLDSSFLNPMSAAYSRKQRRQTFSEYLRISPWWLKQTRHEREPGPNLRGRDQWMFS